MAEILRLFSEIFFFLNICPIKMARLVFQQCLTASIQTNLTINSPKNLIPVYEKIGEGAIIYAAFLKEATEELILKITNTLVTSKIYTSMDNTKISIIDANCDVMIIPQATMTGKLKNKTLQYHQNIDKIQGEKLFELFVNNIKSIIMENNNNSTNRVVNGTYGNIQALSLHSAGPHTLVLDF